MNERVMAHILRGVLSSPIGWLLVTLTRRFYPAEIKNWVQVTHIQLTLPRLDPEFDGYRLVQISDFHIGTWLDRKRLEEAVDLVNQQRPDFIAITGDFVTYEPEKFAPELVAVLRRLRTRDGAAAILGNHDHWTDPKLIREVLQSAHIRDLSNQVLTLQRGQACLHIAGVDSFMLRLANLKSVLQSLPAGGAAILLAHEPDYADRSAASGRFDLQLSGHSHGGQVQLPFIGPPFLPSFARKYPAGLYHVGDMLLYTNRGLGTAEIPVRFNCPAEITVYTLCAPSRPGSTDKPANPRTQPAS